MLILIMSVDKFGRHENSLMRESMRGAPGQGFKLTPEGNYDMQNKILRNVSLPILDEDVATKRYVTENTPNKDSEKWLFSNKRLSNIGNPVSDNDAVNVRSMKQYTMTISGLDAYNANKRKIINMSSGTHPYHAATLKNVHNMCLHVSDKHKEVYKLFAAKVFHYIHKVMKTYPQGRTSEVETNFINWDDVFKPLDIFKPLTI